MSRGQAFNPLRAIESAWRIAMQAPLPIWVGGLILVMVQGFGGLRGQVNVQNSVVELIWFLVPMLGFSLMLGFLSLLGVSWISVGYYRSIREVMRTGAAEFEDVVKPGGLFITMVVTRVVQTLLVLAAMLPYAIPPTVGMMLTEGLDLDDGIGIAVALLGILLYLPFHIYIALGLVFMPYATALEEKTASQAITRSWEVARGCRWNLVLMGLMSFAMAIAGFLLCCVGILPASILIEVFWCEAYIQATDILGDPEDWWIEGGPGGDGPAHEERPLRPRDVEAEPVAPSAAPRAAASEEATEEGPFDPGRWRADADIPPIEDDRRDEAES